MSDLDRFLKAQERDYETAFSEIKSGRKRSHWIWYIFPQVKGLGFSAISEEYGIDGIKEAKEYMAHPILSKRLIEISNALIELEENDPGKVMGYPDDLKLRSSMTLFAEAAPDETVFAKVLDKYYAGKKDIETLKRIAISVDQMRRSDAYTIENLVSGRELMHRAAMGVYNSYDGWNNKNIAIIVGGGNNGGDGYALAGILKENGISSTVFKASEKMSEDGKYYCKVAVDSGVTVTDLDEQDLDSYDVIVDCILGTGFVGEVRGKAAQIIEAINATKAYVISVDINSGMNGDTGEAGIAVRSDLTVSVGYYKNGMFRGRASELIGKMVNVDIGIVLV